MIQGILSPNARPGIFPANEALPAMSDLENKLHAATDSYDQYEVRGAGALGAAAAAAAPAHQQPCRTCTATSLYVYVPVGQMVALPL
jgi:hypothetical protein